MEILVVASEIAPWVQRTGVAEAVAAFSKALKQVGHTVTVVTPFSTVYEQAGLLIARRLSKLNLSASRQATVYDTQLTSGVQLVMVDLGLQPDELQYIQAAALFSEATALLINERNNLGTHTDIVHVYDWLGSLVPLAIEQVDGARPPTVVTVFDAADAPSVNGSTMDVALGPFAGSPELFVNGQVNLLAAAMRTAKAVMAPSASQAQALEQFKKLCDTPSDTSGTLKDVVSIPIGVDYARANPAIDPAIPSRFDVEDRQPKNSCKTTVERELGLDLDVNRALLYVQATTAEPQAIACIVAALNKMLNYPINIVVGLSASASPLSEAAQAIASQWPRQLAVTPVPAGPIATRLIAAADFILLGCSPSVPTTEHLFALRYGAVPITQISGVLADYLVDCDSKLQTGNCFAFEAWQTEPLLGALGRAVSSFGAPAFEQLQRRIMRQDLGWERPTRRAIQVYRQVLGVRV